MTPEQIRAVYEQQQADWIKRNAADGQSQPPADEKAAPDKFVVDVQRQKAVEYLHVYLSEGKDAAGAFVQAHQESVATHKQAKADPAADSPATVKRDPRVKPALLEAVPTE